MISNKTGCSVHIIPREENGSNLFERHIVFT